VTAGRKKFEFVETGSAGRPELEPGLRDFLKDRSLSGDIREPEIEFLKSLALQEMGRLLRLSTTIANCKTSEIHCIFFKTNKVFPLFSPLRFMLIN
jgi:hypothetical protein